MMTADEYGLRQVLIKYRMNQPRFQVYNILQQRHPQNQGIVRFNNQHHFRPIDYVTPAEVEAKYYAAQQQLDMLA